MISSRFLNIGSMAVIRALMASLVLTSLFAHPSQGQSNEDNATKDALTIREQLEEIFQEGNTKVINQVVDDKAFVDRIFEGVPVDKNFRKGFEKGFSGKGGIRAIFGKISEQVNAGGCYEFVRDIVEKDDVRPLFRLELPQGGVNYHEWKIASTDKGPRVVDVYVHVSGEYLTKTLRTLTLPAMKAAQPNLLQKMFGGKPDVLKGYDDMAKANQLKQGGDFRGALAILDKLPKELQSEKGVAVVKLQCANQIDAATTIRVLEEIEKLFPNDPSMKLCSLDLLASRGMHEELIKTIDELYETLKDPYILSMKADSLLAVDRAREAEEIIDECIDELPHKMHLRMTRLGIMLLTDQHAKTAKYLSELRDDLGVELNDLNDVPEYAKFVKSPEGKAWMKDNQKKQTDGEQ